MTDFIDGLRSQARRLIGGNALALEPQKQPWNLSAKYQAAKRIKDEVLDAYPGWNDAGDAQRHAEMSRRMASEIDPITSFVAGTAHEVDNSIPVSWQKYAPSFMRDHAEDNWHGQGLPEARMDLRNNAEGRRAAAERRLVDPHRLQTSPDGPVPHDAAYRPRP